MRNKFTLLDSKHNIELHQSRMNDIGVIIDKGVKITEKRVQINLYPVQFYTKFIPSSTDFQQWYQSNSMGKGKTFQQMI